MDYRPHRTAAYRVLQDGGGMRFRFFCEVSGAAVCTTRIMPLQPVETARMKAWQTEGREHFSRCQRCGKWVADVMYNPNTLECVDCSPWEEKPAFCPQCGTDVRSDGLRCHRCGRRLQYEREWIDGSA